MRYFQQSSTDCELAITPASVDYWLINKPFLSPSNVDIEVENAIKTGRIKIASTMLFLADYTNAALYNEDLDQETKHEFEKSFIKIRRQIADKLKNLGAEQILFASPELIFRTELDEHPIISFGNWQELVKSEARYKVSKISSKRPVHDKLPGIMLNHPNIQAEYIYTTDNGVRIAVREYHEELLDASKIGDWPLSEKIRILIEAINGSICIRDSGFTHCDIKPENIFVIQDPETGIYTGKVGDLEGLLESNTTAKPDEIIHTLPYSENSLNGNKTNLIDSHRDAFSWALTIASVLASQTSKELAINTLQIATKMSYLVGIAQLQAVKLIARCSRGASILRESRPSLEELRSALEELRVAVLEHELKNEPDSSEINA